MESKRQQKFARLIQKELAGIFLSDIKHSFTGAFITVTSVKPTADLSIAKVYLSFITLKTSKEEMIKSIREKTKLIRQQLSIKIGKQIRVVPDLQFFIDDSAEYATKMSDLISTLNIPPADESEKQ
jgi:ribosome-binding factor A